MRTLGLQVFLLAWAVRIGNKVSVMIKGTDTFLSDSCGTDPAVCFFSSVQLLTRA